MPIAGRSASITIRNLSFDTEAALAYAALFAVRRKAGRPSGTIDLMVAAIARARRASIVTRNVADFDELGLTVINPWEHALRPSR